MSKNSAPRWTEAELKAFNQKKTLKEIEQNRALGSGVPQLGKHNPFHQPMPKDLFGKAVPVKKAKGPKMPKVKKIYTSKEKEFVERQIIIFADKHGLILTRERVFASEIKRKWRFDYDLTLDHNGKIIKIAALEWEGLFVGRAGDTAKSGHLTPGGYTANCSKYNCANLMGWRILRFTPKNYEEIGPSLKIIEKIVNKIVNQKNSTT